jgi:hypothetical protein
MHNWIQFHIVIKDYSQIRFVDEVFHLIELNLVVLNFNKYIFLEQLKESYAYIVQDLDQPDQ